jgi:MFS family permease
MSQSKQENGSEGAAARTLEVDLGGVAPANDVAAAPAVTSPSPGARAVERVGPLGLPRVYWMLWTGMLLNRLGGTVFVLLGIYLTRERGLSAELAGLVISLHAVGGLFAGPVGGTLADRLGRRATLLVGTAAAGTFMLALGLARSTAAIVAIAPFLGFFTDLCRPPLQAAVADVVPPAERRRAYGLLYWAINLGFAGAAASGGLLAERHFTLLFVIDALTTFGYGAIVLAGVRETKPAAVASAAAARGERQVLAPLGDRRFVRFVLVQTLMLLAFAQVITALPLDMRAHGLATARIGWLLGLNGVIIVIAQPIALRTLRGLTHLQWVAAGCLFTGLGLGATALAGGAIVYALSAALWTLGEIGWSTGAPALVAELAPADRRGAYQGTFQLGWGVASTTGPALGTFVLARLGSATLWLGCLAVCLAAAALHLRAAAARR